MQQRIFLNWIKHASHPDLCFLIDHDRWTPSINFYNEREREIAQPLDLPWPVEYCLYRWSTRHIHTSCRSARGDIYIHALKEFENKLMWRTKLRRNDAPQPPFKIPHASTPTCPPFLSAEYPMVRAWIARCRGILSSAISRDICQYRSSAISAARASLPLWRVARRMLRRRNLCVVPNDKLPGYTVINADAYRRAHDEILKSEAYRPTLPMEASMDYVFAGYRRVCSAIAKLDANIGITAHHLLRSLTVPQSAPYTRLMLNIKSHKPKGEVEFRNIHAGSTWAFNGVACWISHQLQTPLDQLQHLLKGDRQLVEQLQQVRYEPSDKMYRIDIKHFYMSGSPEVLSAQSCQLLPKSPRQTVLKDAIEWTLVHQWVQSCNNISYPKDPNM